jgi:epoxyqueuosine reductase
MKAEAHNHARMIKEEAQRLGFMACGISKAEFLSEEAHNLEAWLKGNYHGDMQWMENNFDKRVDPTKLVDGAKSVISVLLNYYPEKQQNADAPQISKYAYGRDYHFVIKEKLKQLTQFITENIGEVNGRAFVDSAPVLDRAWAERCGLGWIGKHSLLLSKQAGSFFFIGEIICDLALPPDQPTTEHCGTCTRCIDACPTDAIVQPFVVDANKCISYLTIEYKKELPESFKNSMENWAFGCDICQDVCPWNRFSTPTKVADFTPDERLLHFSRSEWMEITEEVFQQIFKNSAVKRTKFEGLKRNLNFLEKPDSF